jgi:hypothetical protein
VSVHLQTSTTDLVPVADKPFSLESIPRAVREAGFTPGEMTITVTGPLERSDAGWALQLPGWNPLAVRWSGDPSTVDLVHRDFLVEFEQGQAILTPVEP